MKRVLRLFIPPPSASGGSRIEMSYYCFTSSLSIDLQLKHGIIQVHPTDECICDLTSSDIDIITEAIIDGMNKKLPRIITGSAMPFFSIVIDAGKNGEGHEKDIYQFTMKLDIAPIFNSSDKTVPSVTVSARRKNIEELITFFKEIKASKSLEG